MSSTQKLPPPLRIAVLGSGRGTNCQSIIDAIASGRLRARIVCVLSDVENAPILDRARRHNIPAQYISAAPYRTKLEGPAEDNYIAALRAFGAEVVALAGFMRLVKGKLLEAFPSRILNIHPALLPAFPGMDSWKQALAHGAKITGCTVHFVDAGVDSGPIIIQRSVPVLENDTPEVLHARIQLEEHKAYPDALQMLADNRLVIEGRCVRIRED
jgi:phosphoribosylglycinamide formyltransferase-1